MKKRNKDFFDIMQRRIRDLEMFQSIFQDLTSILRLDEVLQRILDKMRILIDAEGLALFRLDKEKSEFYFAAADNENVHIDKLKNLRIPADKGIVGWVAKYKKSIIVNDPINDKRFHSGIDKKTGFATQAILAVPVIFKGNLLAVIEAVNKKKTIEFNDDDLVRIEQLAICAAIAIRNADLFETAHKLSITDPLTGLSNTRHFYEEFDMMLKNARKNRKNFAVLIFDMDNFKNVVDTYEHQTSSKTLVEISKIIKNIASEKDVICRFGGDEFVILQEDADKEKAIELATKIITAIKELKSIEAGKINVSKVTASCGIAVYPDAAKSLEKLFYLADKAMYKVKNTIKNNYYVWE